MQRQGTDHERDPYLFPESGESPENIPETLRQGSGTSAPTDGFRKHKKQPRDAVDWTVIGLQFGSLFRRRNADRDGIRMAGSWPSGGNSIKSKDAPMVLGCIVMLTITFSVINLIVDLLYAYIDPRIKAQYKKK